MYSETPELLRKISMVAVMEKLDEARLEVEVSEEEVSHIIQVNKMGLD